MSDPLRIFICYAWEDRDPLDLLRKKLAPLVHSGRILLWYDREITGGKEWDQEIRFNLKTADVVLLLISDDFFESDYIKSVELREALDGHARQENVVVPVILQDCLWDAHHELSRLQALPDDAKPIYVEEYWKKPELGFANVARGVVRVLDDPETQARRIRKLDRLKAPAETEGLEARKLKEKTERAEEEKAEQKRREDAFQSFIDMVPVQGGTLQFGDKLTVTVSDFRIGKYPVTQKQWQEIMGNNPSYFKGDDLPVECVSWDDSKKFIQKLNERFLGHDFRLPSEAEWEYAARGGRLSKGYKYAGSDNLGEVGWYKGNSGSKTHPVGQKMGNQLGLYDMSGNVWAWCEDDWHDDPAVMPPSGVPYCQQPKRGDYRVIRGGSWYRNAWGCRVSFRGCSTPDYRGNNLGLRLASASRR